MARVGVIPAAGYATRLQPLPCSKEVLHVWGRPVIDYMLERMTIAGCSEIRVVTRPEKTDVIERATEQRAQVVKAHPATLSESVLTALADLADDDVVMLGFPDSVWEPVDGFVRLGAAVEGGDDAALGLFRMDEPERSDVVRVAEDGFIESIDVRPARPASNLIWGCAAARAKSFDGLRADVQLGEHFDHLARSTGVRGIYLSERYFDIGTRDALKRVRQKAGSP